MLLRGFNGRQRHIHFLYQQLDSAGSHTDVNHPGAPIFAFIAKCLKVFSPERKPLENPWRCLDVQVSVSNGRQRGFRSRGQSSSTPLSKLEWRIPIGCDEGRGDFRCADAVLTRSCSFGTLDRWCNALTRLTGGCFPAFSAVCSGPTCKMCKNPLMRWPSPTSLGFSSIFNGTFASSFLDQASVF